VKQAIKRALGAAVCNLPGLGWYKNRLFSSWTTDAKNRTTLDNLMLAAASTWWFKHVYLAESDPEKREALKAPFMGGESGRDWARHYEESPIDLGARVGALAYSQACPLLFELDNALRDGEPALVIQIGSSSGRELAWLAERHPRHDYLGTDIFDEVIAYSAAKHGSERLKFVLWAAKDAAELARPGNRRAVYFSSGSLNYVQPEHVAKLFTALGERGKTEFFVQETATLKPRPDSLKGSGWSGNFTYTHDYRHYAESARFKTLDCRIIEPWVPQERYPNQLGVGHYYYRGIV
jgi:hypothetical protein